MVGDFDQVSNIWLNVSANRNDFGPGFDGWFGGLTRFNAHLTTFHANLTSFYVSLTRFHGKLTVFHEKTTD